MPYQPVCILHVEDKGDWEYAGLSAVSGEWSAQTANLKLAIFAGGMGNATVWEYVGRICTHRVSQVQE